MAAPRWRVEFDRDAAKDFRKLGEPARRTILRYLRERSRPRTTRGASESRLRES